VRKAILVLGDGSTVALEGRFVVIDEAYVADETMGLTMGLVSVVEYKDGAQHGVNSICNDVEGVLRVLNPVLQKTRRKKET
jgi:hypothetical protein